MSSSSASTAKTKITNPPQLVESKEPESKTKVILIGTMYYNPTSINMVQNIIQDLAENKNKLGSVIVNNCDVR
jgi:hypothetical protein